MGLGESQARTKLCSFCANCAKSNAVKPRGTHASQLEGPVERLAPPFREWKSDPTIRRIIAIATRRQSYLQRDPSTSAPSNQATRSLLSTHQQHQSGQSIPKVNSGLPPIPSFALHSSGAQRAVTHRRVREAKQTRTLQGDPI